MSDLGQTLHNPDVLSCLANLSSDEVFTPPRIVNQMLDTLPQEIFSDRNATFLDPACKSGVFLREIAKRLIKGLEAQIPDLQARIDHVFQKQLFGLAITELTSLMSRRSLYCSKFANSRHSVSKFQDPQGNVRFGVYSHVWAGGDKCTLCGASKSVYGEQARAGRESHAYPFLHIKNLEELFGMKFDVIIGNPPYQLSDGGDSGGTRTRRGAIPLYQKFIQQAIKLSPRYLTMIVPSRWFAGGRGLDEFRLEILEDTRIRKLVDFPSSADCFPGVEIKGGVCFFLWDKEHKGDCEVKTIQGQTESVMERPLLEDGCDTFVRYNEAISILHKVARHKEESFANIVRASKPFGFRTFVEGEQTEFVGAVKLYANGGIGWVKNEDVVQNRDWIDKHKIYISMAYGAGEDFPHQILNKPFLGEPNTCCTETYLLIGPFENKKTAENVLRYITTKFFRFLVLQIKNTQHATQKVYKFVPLQDFTQPWTDEKLYAKYDLSAEEIAFIESMIRPMDAVPSEAGQTAEAGPEAEDQEDGGEDE